MNSPSAIPAIIAKTYALARPYGQKKLAFIAILALIQGFAAMVGVSSIFPFLALASDPQRIYGSQLGTRLMQLLPSLDHNQLLVLAGILSVGLLFVSSIINIVADFLRVRYARDLGHWLRMRLLYRLICQPYAYHLENNSAILAKKVFNDVNIFVQSVLTSLLDCFSRIVTALFLIGALFLAEPKIAALATLSVGIFYGGFIIGLHRLRARMSDGAKSSLGGIFFTGQTIFNGVKAISVSGRARHFLDRFASHSRRLSRIQTWLPVLGNTPRYLLEPFIFGGIVSIVVVSAAYGRDFVSLLPSLGVMALATYRLLPNLQWIYGQVNIISTQRHALEEIYDEMHVLSPPHPSAIMIKSEEACGYKHTIEFDNVGFRYSSTERETLKGVTLSIPKNVSVGIVGKTGSGKSTFMDLILGLHRPTTGRILVDGKPIDSPQRIREWQNSIGYVPQDIFLLDDTIEANIAFGYTKNDIDREKVRQAARMAQIGSFIEAHLPHSYETVVGERGVRLSGGERQRIALARALYNSPSILILDEATSALDNITESNIMSVVYSLYQYLTIFIVTHRISTVEKCDIIFSVADGRVKQVSLDSLLIS